MKHINYKFIIGIISVIIVGVLFVWLVTLRLATRPSLQRPPARNITPLSQTNIDKTTDGEIQKMSGIVKKETRPDGSTTYDIRRSSVLPPDQIVTKKGVAVFEKVYVPEDVHAIGYTTLQDYIKNYGQPDSIAGRSKQYGDDFAYYVYSSKGFALVVNTNNGSIHDIQLFRPMTVNEYIKQFGQDINTNPPSGKGE